jgi:hypothetical protein
MPTLREQAIEQIATRLVNGLKVSQSDSVVRGAAERSFNDVCAQAREAQKNYRPRDANMPDEISAELRTRIRKGGEDALRKNLLFYFTLRGVSESIATQLIDSELLNQK